ncbi:hypothetical protein NADFUDRAFT_49137 [Nadsonia fulvescens var. elongata DSM 6958]|uniref:Uncharacterized protein n=1 Tax=Nadsonia fulvescens var. elongata DSM 6958 TaxID=857566 RepID=A0A1E3PT83_9ASCO|nr:hypothetical protein NADFUDRAFT_49137 [Nadsonia fulvescens var. elongata DSM 6958]
MSTNPKYAIHRPSTRPIPYDNLPDRSTWSSQNAEIRGNTTHHFTFGIGACPLPREYASLLQTFRVPTATQNLGLYRVDVPQPQPLRCLSVHQVPKWFTARKALVHFVAVSGSVVR